MIRSALAATLLLCLATCTGRCGRRPHAPPPAPFRKVSELVKLPDFLPGMGTLYVDPKTLPDGPFLAYDHSGRLVSTIYMVPLKDIDEHTKFTTSALPGSRWTMSISTTTPAIPASRCRTITSCCGMFPRATKRPSRNSRSC